MGSIEKPTDSVNGHADTSGNAETIPLGRYLWTRIKQIGVSHIMGVPGDFNLTLLDHIYDVDGLEWFGNTNELNAAYAADGYARASHGPGCLVTTHGVGELSALNGVAGAMTEQVKLIHVVGQTSRKMQENRMMIHHSIGPEPDHQIFNKASREFRAAAAELQSERGATEEIDRVLRQCFVKSCPVYIFVPIDLVDLPVPAAGLKTPIDVSPPVDQKSVQESAETILSNIYSAKNPAFLIDCLVDRHNATADLKALLEKMPFPVFSTNMSKGIVDENHPNFVGLYNGLSSGPGVAAAIEAADLVLIVGNLASDTNSGGFTRKVLSQNAIYINPSTVCVKTGPNKPSFSKVPLTTLLQTLTSTVDPSKLPSPKLPTLPDRPLEDDSDALHITQSWLWPRLCAFLRPHDILFGETGTASFGIPDSTFPPDIQWITQTYYGSIGYATPASLGAVLAQKSNSSPAKPDSRTILVTGDGSLMLTVQEVATMVKHQLTPVIFVINNNGYTIERVIHGARQSYNDIAPFNYSHMLSFFNMPAEQAKKSFHRAETKEELDAILELESVKEPGKGSGPVVVEVVVDMLDVPWRLATQVATRGPEAVKEMKEAGFKVRDMEHGSGFWS